jgi:hypothetical protein
MKDEQTPTVEPVATLEPSGWHLTARGREALRTGGPAPEDADVFDLTLQNGTTADPFAGFYAPNAVIVENWWAGLPNFCCSACSYAHLDRERTEAHLSTHGQTFTQGARP